MSRGEDKLCWALNAECHPLGKSESTNGSVNILMLISVLHAHTLKVCYLKTPAGLSPPPSHLRSRGNHSLDNYVGLYLPDLQDVFALAIAAIICWLPTIEEEDLDLFSWHPYSITHTCIIPMPSSSKSTILVRSVFSIYIIKVT